MDCLIVGCGLSGCVVARFLAEECGKKVTVWERRDHIGGNMYDYVDEHGILVHKYGPHTFHTNMKKLYEYICKYTEWDEYKLTCMAEIDGKVTPTPFNFKTIDDFYSKGEAIELKQRIKEYFGNRDTATVVELLECEDNKIRDYAKFLFDKDYSLYTAKQWGLSAKQIDPSILKRVPVRFSYDVGYFDDTYQVMPKGQYTDFFQGLLDHNNITVKLGVEALKHLSISSDGKKILMEGKKVDIPVIYTGALDELFELSEGNLPYRSLIFDWKYEEIDSFQDAPVVAYPQAKDYTRITEYKKIPVQDVFGTTYAVEYSLQYDKDAGMEPYYPVLTEFSKQQYKVYQDKAKKIDNLFFCGRLADFKYYNMDQALYRALRLCDEIKAFLLAED